MNEQVKQRLVGAVVLISLAVIFIPMLLDGDDSTSMPRFGSNIPAQPAFDFEPLEIPIQPVAPIPDARPRVIHTVEEDANKNGEQEGQVGQGQKPAETSAAVSGKPEPAESPPVTAAREKSDTAPISWVVQVGSFSNSANAMALRDKLRKNGFSAFVEKYRDNGRSSYRVRVGPELGRDNAQLQLKRLEQKLQLKGIIMGHP